MKSEFGIAYIDCELICACCGNYLNKNWQTKADNKDVFAVEPCEKCLEAAAEEGDPAFGKS